MVDKWIRRSENMTNLKQMNGISATNSNYPIPIYLQPVNL